MVKSQSLLMINCLVCNKLLFYTSQSQHKILNFNFSFITNYIFALIRLGWEWERLWFTENDSIILDVKLRKCSVGNKFIRGLLFIQLVVLTTEGVRSEWVSF